MNFNHHISPCKDCSERYSSCWSSCEKYLAWKAEVNRMNDNRREYQKSQMLPANVYARYNKNLKKGL